MVFYHENFMTTEKHMEDFVFSGDMVGTQIPVKQLNF